ncbi:hypothetical protein YC2023_010875 [Brassica napus]
MHTFMLKFSKDRQDLISKLSIIITIVAKNSLKYDFPCKFKICSISLFFKVCLHCGESDE